jgi:hypothetical protein
VAIRADPSDDADDGGGDAGADVLLALIKLLTLGASAAPGGLGGAAAPSTAALLRAVSMGAGAGGAGGGAAGEAAEGGGPTVAMVREASAVLSAIVEASSPEALAAAAPGSSGGGGAGAAATGVGKPLLRGRSLGGAGSAGGMSANGWTGSVPATVPGGAPPSAFSGAAARPSQAGTAQQGGAGAPDPQQPLALLPSLVTDHSTGLAVLRTWSGEGRRGSRVELGFGGEFRRSHRTPGNKGHQSQTSRDTGWHARVGTLCPAWSCAGPAHLCVLMSLLQVQG